VNKNGEREKNVELFNNSDKAPSSLTLEWEQTFHLMRLPNMIQPLKQHTTTTTILDGETTTPGDEEDDDDESSDSNNAKRMKLWTLQNVHGSYLGVDHQTLSLMCSKVPSFWQADTSTLSLVCTNITPSRQRHYRKTWAKQSVDYSTRMREWYLHFQLGKMGIREALGLVKDVWCYPFTVRQDGPSLRNFFFQNAEYARKEGHPDWVQLVALM